MGTSGPDRGPCGMHPLRADLFVREIETGGDGDGVDQRVGIDGARLVFHEHAPRAGIEANRADADHRAQRRSDQVEPRAGIPTVRRFAERVGSDAQTARMVMRELQQRTWCHAAASPTGWCFPLVPF